MALFTNRMSTHILTLPFVLGMTTNGDTRGVGPSTFSMIPLLTRFLIPLSLSVWHERELAHLGCWATGWIEVLMWSLTVTSFSWPMPPKSVGNFFFNASCREDTGVTLLIWRFRSGQQLTSNWEEIHGFPSSHIDGHCIVLAWRQDHNQTLPVWIIVHLNHRRTIVRLSAVTTQEIAELDLLSIISVEAPVSTTISTSTLLTLTFTIGILDLSHLFKYTYSLSLLLEGSSCMSVTWRSLVFQFSLAPWGLWCFVGVKHILAKWFGFPHFLHVCPLAGHGLPLWGHVRPHLRHVFEVDVLGLNCVFVLGCRPRTTLTPSLFDWLQLSFSSVPVAWVSLISRLQALDRRSLRERFSSRSAYLLSRLKWQCWMIAALSSASTSLNSQLAASFLSRVAYWATVSPGAWTACLNWKIS